MIRTLVTAAALALTLPLLAAAPAHADDRRCSGTIRAVSIDGDVIVPQGKTCRLVGTRVDGNVKVKRNAKLVARGVRVGGNIQAENHKRVVVQPRAVNGGTRKSRIGGSIQLKQGGGGVLRRTVTEGDIQLFSNDGRFQVYGNRVGGNLQCKSNQPRPVGDNNRVEGDKENQCKGF